MTEKFPFVEKIEKAEAKFTAILWWILWLSVAFVLGCAFTAMVGC